MAILDEPVLDKNGNIIDFPDDTGSFKFKQKILGQTGNGGTKDVKIMVPLTNFRRIFELSLINCEISFQLKWSRNCIIVAGTAIIKIQHFK